MPIKVKLQNKTAALYIVYDMTQKIPVEANRLSSLSSLAQFVIKLNASHIDASNRRQQTAPHKKKIFKFNMEFAFTKLQTIFEKKAS